MKNKFLRGLIGTSIFIAVFGAASTAVMLLWNWLVPQIIGWTAVTFWQAAGLVLLNKLLFGGMGRHCFGMNALRRSGPTFPTWKERAAMRDRIRAMGKEERRENIRRQMFGCGPGQPETMTAVKKKRRLDSRSDLPLVYDQYKPELEGYIRHRVDSAEDTEDILQDVFYKLTKTDLQENPIEYLSAWLYQAVTNRIIDRRRKKREQALPETRQENEDDYFLDSLSDFLADDGNDPEIMFRNELIREEIELALSELPPEQRSVFELTEYDGIPYKEIAETTGVPVPTLLSRKHYAIGLLRKRLQQLYREIVPR